MSDKSDSGAAVTSAMQPTGSLEQDTITVTEDGSVETITIAGGNTEQPVVVTVGGVPQTITFGSPTSCEYRIRGQVINSSNNIYSRSKYVAG